MSEPEEIPEGFQKERWVFIGQGVTDKNKQVARFRDGKGTGWTIGWDRSTHGHLAVGYVYEVLASDTSVRKPYQWTGEKAPDADELRMADRYEKMEADRKRMEAKARNQDPDLERLLSTVHDYAARFKTPGSKAALIRLLEKEVWKST